jgi:predicted amidohydrolase YtcJ
MKKLFFLLILAAFSSCSKKQNVDLMVFNATIYTVDSAFTTADAMAVHNGKIVAIGTKTELEKQFTATEKSDLGGKFVYPGFYDAHCHFYGYGSNLIKRVDLSGTKSFEEILAKLKQFAQTNPENIWIEGRGWDQNDWEVKEFPHKEKLDELFPDKAVFLIRIDGHAAIINTKAMKLAGISENTFVEGGQIKLENGKPNGILIDKAMEIVYAAIPELSLEMQTKALLQAQDSCFKVGLTTVDDAGLEYGLIRLIDSLQQANVLKMNIYAMLSPTVENFEHFVKNGPYSTDKLNVRAIKLYADGALGSRGALLSAEYSDAPGTKGLQLTKASTYDSILHLAYTNNYQMSTHAIGDSAVKFVLEHYGTFLKGKNDKRWRIEHSQIVAPEDFAKYGQFSIVPSIQPTHATSDMYWAGQRLGSERIKGAYAYKQLLEQNGWVANGSDFPIESINPLYGFYAAVVRKDHQSYPENGFQPENALTREQALKGMTIWAAKVNFEEKEKGSLEAGKKADFVVLPIDLLKADEKELFKIAILATYVDGKMVYSANK